MDAPVDVLAAEHALTRRMIRVLTELSARVEAGEPFPAGDVATVLNYFREFVELAHHRKESIVFYPFAAMVGGEDAAESVGELIADHESSKLLLQSLCVFWEPDGLLDEERRAFAEVARTYGARLSRHMDIEEQLLFPVASSVPGDEQIRLIEELESIGGTQKPAEHWLTQVDRLERTYLA